MNMVLTFFNKMKLKKTNKTFSNRILEGEICINNALSVTIKERFQLFQ